MPAILEDEPATATSLHFPPVTKSHILHCSYHYWHPLYRTITPKARLISLTTPFLNYLRADGIILPDDDDPPQAVDKDSAYSSSTQEEGDSDDEDEDVAAEWRQVHQAIRDTIAELGGKVMPKLNWSAPKDATFMNANTMECRKPGDIYLLLKSSDFVTHDLEHAFDDCISLSEEDEKLTLETIPYTLALRKAVPTFNPSVEFRCFVRSRKLLCICQRDLNHYDFLSKMQHRLSSLINEFFQVRLRDTFPDANFAFDVYVPQPYDRVWLVDVNPWAPRTDPILFSWQELLSMPDPVEPPVETEPSVGQESFMRFCIDPVRRQEMFARLSIDPSQFDNEDEEDLEQKDDDSDDRTETGSDEEEADEELYGPELRLISRSDPEARSFATPQYSAHKLPKDVVDASQSGEGLREFAKDWRQFLEDQQRAGNVAHVADSDADD